MFYSKQARHLAVLVEAEYLSFISVGLGVSVVLVATGWLIFDLVALLRLSRASCLILV